MNFPFRHWFCAKFADMNFLALALLVPSLYGRLR